MVLRKRCTFALLIFSLLGGLEVTQAKVFWNTDMEYGVYQSQPRKWSIEGEGGNYQAYLDNKVSKSGNKSLFLSLEEAEVYTILNISEALAPEKTLEIKSHAKLKQSDILQVQLLLFDPLKGEVLTSVEQGLEQKSWQETSLEYYINKNYQEDQILLVIKAEGSGSFWLDTIQIKIDGEVIGNGLPDFREATEKEIRGLNNKAIPFEINTFDANPLALKELSKIVSDTRLVALGENSHGSSTIYELKLELIKYLVERKGFSIFALEMPVVEADYINDYVLNKVHDLNEVIDNLTYPSWQTEEMIDIIQWMRGYNKRHKNKIEFAGYDMQNGWSALRAVKNFVNKHDISLLPELEMMSDLYKNALQKKASGNQLSAEAKQFSMLLKTRSYNQVSEKELAKVHHFLNVFLQSVAFELQTEDAQSRDYYMAENIRWLVENSLPKRKIIISADNTHITKAGAKTGAYLERWYKKNYVAIGFTFEEGTYSAYGEKPYYKVHPPYIGAYEKLFSKAKYKNFILDLKQANEIPILNQKAAFRAIGSRPQEVTQFYEIELTKHFDAVIFLKESRHTSYLKE